MNRLERRKRASEQRRAAGAQKPVAQPSRHPTARGFAQPDQPAPDPLAADIVRTWREASPSDIEGPAVHAAAAASDAMDARLAGTWAESGLTPACSRGCRWCCTVRVMATVPEVIRLVTYARAALAPEELARVEARAMANAAQTHGSTALGYPPRLECAFLDEGGACTVHPARPLACRREHAVDVSQCKAGYDLAAPGRDHPIDRLLAAIRTSNVVLDTYQRGLTGAGVDAAPYELQEAAHIAFSDPDAIAGWLEGRPTFARARLNEAVEAGKIATPRAALPVVRER
jgi:Fe-S-cluster containining protein